jgi:hypothetical protein
MSASSGQNVTEMTTRIQRPPAFRLGDRALEAKRQAEKQRYHLPERPEGQMPRVPDDITEMRDRELVVLMTQVTRWAEHLAVQLAMAEVDERWADSAREKERALASLGRVKDVTERKAKAYESEAFLAADDTYHEAMAYRKLVSVLYENADRWSALLSRELTRRVNMEPRTRRADR